MRVSREWANHVSSWSGEGDVGAGGMRSTFTGSSSLSQSALSHMGRGGGSVCGGRGPSYEDGDMV